MQGKVFHVPSLSLTISGKQLYGERLLFPTFDYRDYLRDFFERLYTHDILSEPGSTTTRWLLNIRFAGKAPTVPRGAVDWLRNHVIRDISYQSNVALPRYAGGNITVANQSMSLFVTVHFLFSHKKCEGNASLSWDLTLFLSRVTYHREYFRKTAFCYFILEQNCVFSFKA